MRANNKAGPFFPLPLCSFVSGYFYLAVRQEPYRQITMTTPPFFAPPCQMASFQPKVASLLFLLFSIFTLLHDSQSSIQQNASDIEV
jgi:hypothetical protein